MSADIVMVNLLNYNSTRTPGVGEQPCIAFDSENPSSTWFLSISSTE